MSLLKAVSLLALAGLACGVSSSRALAYADGTYIFSGTCADCTDARRTDLPDSGVATATLVISDGLAPVFSYASANFAGDLVPSPGTLTINSLDTVANLLNVTFTTGPILLPHEPSIQTNEYGVGFALAVAADGTWLLTATALITPAGGPGGAVGGIDYGTQGSVSVPEPASAALLLAALGMTGMIARRPARRPRS